jgi:Zn-dependent protease with chaperone function
MIGFYLLAIGMAAVLLYIPWAIAEHVHRIPAKVLIFFVGGALVILWSIVPRPDRFEPPGPVLAPDRQGRLFDLIGEVATATGQAMPREVYLVPDVNAWVAVRGGVMGFGSRRVMGLGLPLLQTLSVAELRAVLAHEFGHYHGGDTRLGPWVYKTRAAIARTLSGLSGFSSTLQIPFIWYGNGFLRISHAISRGQELSADQLAARLYGPGPLTSALRMIRRAAAAFPAYWSTEVSPVLAAGYIPPVAGGFERFLATDQVVSAIDAWTRRPETRDPYDTHPPLDERVAAVLDLPEVDRPAEAGPAIRLVDDLDGLERQLTTMLGAPDAARNIRWEDVGNAVWVPAWRAAVDGHATVLAGVAIASLVQSAPTLVRRLGAMLQLEDESPAPEDVRTRVATSVVGQALGLALHDRGCRIRALPGEPVSFENERGTLAPFQAVDDILLAKIEPEAWRRTCAQFRLEDAVLAPGPAVEVTPAPADRTSTDLVPTAPRRLAMPAGDGAAQIRCWSCRHPLPVSAATRGGTIRCPGCGTSQKLLG